ncbi:MAG: hypothetical protein ACKVPX_02530 [Myxococcaceae bacterium]
MNATHVIQAVPEVLRLADRLLMTHPLQAADALQLGAALFAAERVKGMRSFLTFDDRLNLAAAKEGLDVPLAALQSQVR